MDDCRFCAVAAGEREAHVVSEDDRTVAFLDANPAREGHALVVPRRHVEDLVLAEERTAAAVCRTARTVGQAMAAVLDPDGFSTFHTTGGLVGSVAHAHLHVVPRDADDDISLALERESLSDHDPEALVGRLRTELAVE